MNRTVLTALAIATICIGVAAARPQGVALGLMGGDPSGLSLKVWTGSRVALDAGLGYSYLWRGSALHIHGDMLWHTRSLVEEDDGFLPLYIGLGGRVKLSNADNKLRVGVRVPFGVEYVFASFPLGLFLELVPVFDLTPPDGWFGYNSSIGFRYYFSGLSGD